MTEPRAGQPQPASAPQSQAAQPAGPVMRLEDLETLALRRNPTLAQAEAAVRAAEGRGRQAGMFPNPVVGYSAENVSTRRPSETAEHLFFVEQTFPLGGKLSKARRVFASERDAAEASAAAQRQRVLNEVRALYSEALGAQRLVELRGDLARLAREAVEISRELYNVGQADKPDLLEIEIEAGRADIERLKAENDREQVWRQLAATVGDPTIRPAPLAGSLEDAAATLDEQQLLPLILRDSPEVRAAEARVARASAALVSARAQRAPDLFVRGGAGYNQERGEAFGGRPVGPVVAVETGVRLPLWNRNQGGIAAAEADVAIAERDVERLRLALGARLASSLRAQRNARQVAEKYRAEIIPAARAAYEMYLSNFRQMAASYPQVLIAQRTLFQVQVEYARSLVELRRSLVSLRGFLLTGGALDAVGTTGEGFGMTTTGGTTDH
jgi:cobalt-zinc-cadmium efflux system outer membrane protein